MEMPRGRHRGCDSTAKCKRCVVLVAGLRSVTLPAPVLEQLRGHLDAYVERDDQAWVFTGPTGQPLRRSNFSTPAATRTVTSPTP